MGGQTDKALCSPANSCNCYLPQWKNEVKSSRCVQDQAPVTWLPGWFKGKEVL
jgi:hypothetical protein